MEYKVEYKYVIKEKIKSEHHAKRYEKYIEYINEKNKNRILDKYERHHIIPKSFGGTNKKDNLIKMTYREHYIAHIMLVLVYKTRNMATAISMMSNQGKIKSSRLFEKVKTEVTKIFSEVSSGKNNNMYNKVCAFDKDGNKVIVTKEEYKTGEYISRTAKENNGMYGKKHTEETKRKVSLNHARAFKGRHHTEETKQKVSAINKGKKHTDETKQKMAAKRGGHKNPAAQSVSIEGQIFLTLKDAALAYNITAKVVSTRCKSTKKYNDWFYIKKEA